MDTPTSDATVPNALLEAALADMRAVSAALGRIDEQFRVDRARTGAAVDEARLGVEELRVEVRELLQTLRNDVHATVTHVQQMLDERSVSRVAFAELAARVAELERALAAHGS